MLNIKFDRMQYAPAVSVVLLCKEAVNGSCILDTQTAIFQNTITHLDDDTGIRERHPLYGIGMPEDIVGAAIFLASSEARWITGACLPVDGGYTAQ